jgi:hypothetical protein
MYFLKKTAAYVTCAALILSGCVTNSGSGNETKRAVGPQTSSFFEGGSNFFQGKESAEARANRPKLDVVIPIFDPGLPKEPSDNAEDKIWPELRRAESRRFAVKLKDALEATEQFGAVRVTPDATATGDIYILGFIEESNGEDVEIKLQGYDISGKNWFSKSFDHEVQQEFHENIRNNGKDPYDPVFEKAAKYIVEELDDHNSKELEGLKHLADIRFGASMSEETFAQHMKMDDGQIKLIGLPSDDDPVLRRTRAIRIRDQLFVDRIQTNFEGFSRSMQTSYLVWQEQALLELKAAQAAQNETTQQAIFGVLAIGVAVLAAAASSRSSAQGNHASSTAAATGAVVAGIAGAKLLSDSFQTSKEAKVHRDAIAELGKSIDMELAPQVVAFEKETVKLSGTAKEQFAQWRAFLKKIYALESTPKKQL